MRNLLKEIPRTAEDCLRTIEKLDSYLEIFYKSFTKKEIQEIKERIEFLKNRREELLYDDLYSNDDPDEPWWNR